MKRSTEVFIAFAGRGSKNINLKQADLHTSKASICVSVVTRGALCNLHGNFYIQKNL